MRKYRYQATSKIITSDEQPESATFDQSDELTPVRLHGDTTDIATTYQLALTIREKAPKTTGRSATIDRRGARLVLQLIHARLLSRARVHYTYLTQGTGTEDSIIVIDSAIEAGLSYTDIHPLFSEDQYLEMKDQVRLDCARRDWVLHRHSPSLAIIAPIDGDLREGRYQIADLHTNEERFRTAKTQAHTRFALEIAESMRRTGASRELLLLLQTACEKFDVDPEAVDLSEDEYRTLLRQYQIAS